MGVKCTRNFQFVVVEKNTVTIICEDKKNEERISKNGLVQIREDNSNGSGNNGHSSPTIELSWAFCKHNVYLYFSQLITESNRQLIFLGRDGDGALVVIVIVAFAAAAAAVVVGCYCVYAIWPLTRNSVEYQKRYGDANIVRSKHPLFKYR